MWWIVGLSFRRSKSESSANIIWHAGVVRYLYSVGVELQASATSLAVHLSSKPGGSVVETDGTSELLDWINWWDDGWIDTLVLAVASTTSDESSWNSIDVLSVNVLAFIVKIQSGEDIDWVTDKDLSPNIVSVVDSSDTSRSAFSRALRESSSNHGNSIDGNSLVASLVILVPWSWGWWVGHWSEFTTILLVATASLDVGSWKVGALDGVVLSIWEDVVAKALWHASEDSSIISLVDSRHTGTDVSSGASDSVSGSESWGGVVGVESDVTDDVVWSGWDSDCRWDVLLQVNLVTLISFTEARCLELTAGAFLSMVDECHDLILFTCQQNKSSTWRSDRLLSTQSIAFFQFNRLGGDNIFRYN